MPPAALKDHRNGEVWRNDELINKATKPAEEKKKDRKRYLLIKIGY